MPDEIPVPDGGQPAAEAPLPEPPPAGATHGPLEDDR